MSRERQYYRAFLRLADMSRTAVKKEIRNLDAEQLRELILDLYDFRLPPKEYFSFFLKPDADELLKKYKKAVAAELSRGSYKRVRTRATVLNKLIKNFDSYKAGLDYNIELKMYTFRVLLRLERYMFIPEPLRKYIPKLFESIIREADLNLSADRTIMEINRLISSEENISAGMKSTLSEVMAGLNNPTSASGKAGRN